MEFTNNEKQVMRNAIDLWQHNEGINQKHFAETSSILIAIDIPILKLNTRQKSILKDCIKEFVIYPNESYLGYTDYEVFLIGKELQPIFEFLDTGLGILTKLKDKDYGNFRPFQDIAEKAQSFTSIETVYYSLSGDKIYKVGVVLNSNKGFKIETAHTDFSRFDLVELFKNQFMYVATPAEVVAKIKTYETLHHPEENHKRILSILEPALSN